MENNVYYYIDNWLDSERIPFLEACGEECGITVDQEDFTPDEMRELLKNPDADEPEFIQFVANFGGTLYRYDSGNLINWQVIYDPYDNANGDKTKKAKISLELAENALRRTEKLIRAITPKQNKRKVNDWLNRAVMVAANSAEIFIEAYALYKKGDYIEAEDKAYIARAGAFAANTYAMESMRKEAK